MLDLDKVQREVSGILRGVRQQFAALPHATQGLLAANVGVYALARVPSVRAALSRHAICSYDNTVRQRRWHTVATSFFHHGGLLHLGLNCYGIAIMTPGLKSAMWSKNRDVSVGTQSAVFFVAAAVASNVLALALSTVLLPLRHIAWLGGSGGVYAAFTVVLQRNPDTPWHVMFIPEPLSSETLLAFFIGYETICFLGVLFAGLPSMVAHHAHLLGACVGAAAQQYLLPRKSKIWGW